MDHIKYGVSPTKLYAGGADRPFPEGFVEVDAETYNFICENFDVLAITIEGESLKISIDLPSYKREALAKLSLDDFVVIEGQKVYDYEFALLYSLGSPIHLRDGLFTGRIDTVAYAIAGRNKTFHETKLAIQEATDPSQVDEALEKWQTN